MMVLPSLHTIFNSNANTKRFDEKTFFFYRN
jgi:hypothetical protein